jgi:hypothetical protein
MKTYSVYEGWKLDLKLIPKIVAKERYFPYSWVKTFVNA